MKFLILGHYSYDVLHDSEGAERQTRGGMHQVIERLAGLASRQDRIIPVLGVQSAEHAAIIQELKALPNVDSSGIYPMETPCHRVHYYPQANGTRVACVREMADPIPFERIRKFLDADGVLINMMSGTDLRLETLDEIRMAIRETGTKLHLDFHNLTLGIGPNGERMRRPVPEWRRWAFMADTLQMNEEEIGGLTLERMSEQQTVGHILTLGVKGVVVTRGAMGATLFVSEHKQVIRKDGATPAAPGESGPGSGDRFGAAFFLQYCTTGDLGKSLEFAVAAMTGAE
jgi:sugar/nucleoside kinase (ribokinase family)